MSTAVAIKRDALWLQREAPEMVPVYHAAEVMGLAKETLSEMADAGEVPTIRAKRRRYVPRQWLLDALCLPRLNPVTA